MLPRSRQEDALFKTWLQTHTPDWEEVARKPHPRWKDGPPEFFRAIASPIPDADGFRLFWYESSHKMERDAQARRAAIRFRRPGRGWRSSRRSSRARAPGSALRPPSQRQLTRSSRPPGPRAG